MKKTVTQLLRQWKQASGRFLLSGLLLGSAFASQGQVLVTQDFSTGSGTTAPAGWTTAATTTTGALINWTFSGVRGVTGGTPGFVANYALLDSDAGSATGEDATLESPAFDASTAATYRLEFDNQFRNVSGGGVPTVEVWNGSAWTAVLTYSTAVADGYPNPANHKTIDITSAVGTSSAAKVRFHWVNGSDDWWWAVDNVTITRINCTAPAATYTVVPNCGSNQFSVEVNITNMGSASSIAIKEGNTLFATAAATGTYVAGPFASTTSHTLTLVHNDTVCNLTSPVQTYNCPPPNDEAANAIGLTVNANYLCGSVTNSSTVLATQSADAAPGCSSTGINDDVWFSFVATNASHRISFSNVTTGTMVAALYTGTPGSLTAVPSACASTTLNATGLTPGTTYYVRAYTSVATTTTTTNFTICVGTLPPPPANDECAGAVNVPVNPGTTCSSVISGTLQSATASTGPTSSCGTYDDDVWYSFVATAPSHVVTLQNIAGTVTDLTYQVLSSCGAATALICSDPNTNLITGLTPGNTYYIRVASYTSTGGQNTTFDVCVSNVAPPPANDECANAVNVPVNPTSTCTSVVSGTLVGATSSAGPTSSCGTYDDDVWYSFTATATVHTITLQNLAGSTTDLTFQVLASCGATASLVCSDPQNAVVSGLTPGNTYYLRVASYGSTPLQTSTFDVCISTQPMTFVSTTTAQPTTSSVAAGTTNQQIIRTVVVTSGIANPISVTQLNFNTTGTTNTADITNARVYYTGTSTTFGTTTPFGSVVANPNGTFSVTGSQVLAGDASSNTNNYFFLAYDVNCAATATNVLDAQCTSVTVAGTPQTPTTTSPTGTRAITAATYTATTSQPSTAIVLTGSVDQQVLRVALTGCVGTPVTSITFATTGSTLASDIAAAKVYYTPTTTFANTTQFGSTVANPNGTFTVTGSQLLTASPGYFWLVYDISPTAVPGNVVDASCASALVNGNTATPTTVNPTGTRSIVQALVNDDAPGALLLTVGAGCTGAPYTNVNASQSTGEPVSSCSGTTGTHTVWFKFTAPASGAVRVSTDLGSGGTMTDTRLGLFSAADPSIYGGFSIISCDEDGGSVVINNDVDDPGTYMSVLYATGLTPGATYYVEVDGFITSITGTFCIAVDELSSTMLATAATCASTVQVPEATTTPPAYTGWVPLMDENSKLIALVKNPAGSSVAGYTPAQNINTGAVRQAANGVKYLDRNFRISNATAGTFDVQLFMLTSEQAALEASDPAATLSNLNITRQTGESACTNNFSTGGTNSLITQTGNGSVNGVSWVRFTTPGFSNFFINAGTTPLPVTLKSFSGKNEGAVNLLNWETAEEKNFSHFELQRSADGISFSKLGTVDARGTGSYTYTDGQPFEGQNIYRLKMMDRDGGSTLSKVVKLMSKKGDGLSVNVHPNPVKQQLHVAVTGKIDGKALIHILDITGKVLQTISVPGSNLTIDMSSFAAGTYIIRYTDNTHNTVTKISKN